MKVAISAQGKDLTAKMHPGFGRALGFAIYDLDSGQYSFLSNEQNMTGSRGVGTRTAQDVANTGVQAVITGQIGPKAISYLRSKGVEVYLCSKETVQEAVTDMQAGRLDKA